MEMASTNHARLRALALPLVVTVTAGCNHYEVTENPPWPEETSEGVTEGNDSFPGTTGLDTGGSETGTAGSETGTGGSETGTGGSETGTGGSETGTGGSETGESGTGGSESGTGGSSGA